jgi:hypothetical protein
LDRQNETASPPETSRERNVLNFSDQLQTFK